MDSANTPPVSVAPNKSITEAITIMLTNDFSQLPVMIGEREVKGIISWESIGSRLARGVKCTEVRECMDAAHEISADTSLLAAIDQIVSNEYVLIRDSGKISGIVTTTDLSRQFHQLAEPFLLLGEIENHIRQIIERGRFSKEQLTECRDPNDKGRAIDSIGDMTFGHYIRLLQNPKFWHQVRLGIDCKTFIDRLDEARRIRNDVMHFDSDPMSPDDLVKLRKFTGFLQQLARSQPAAT
ncbi:MAG: CBS domain-containing protein [Alphaproteobacteria bacterium]|nr:CBS domain-containing protein [Alphaproteobacteria bacterium]